MPEYATVTNPDVHLCQQYFSSANFANSKASAANHALQRHYITKRDNLHHRIRNSF